MVIETKDLWQGAYVLAEGGWLAGFQVRRKPDGKREYIFRLTGDGVDDLAQRFKNGDAVCNVRKLKTHVSHLKQVIFGGDSASRE
jgi:hypothetical protein